MNYLYAQLNTVFFRKAIPVRFLWPKRRFLASFFLISSLVLAVLYIVEFNAVLSLDADLKVLNRAAKKAESELLRSETDFSGIYASAISQNFKNKDGNLEKVTAIDYLEKPALVDARSRRP